MKIKNLHLTAVLIIFTAILLSVNIYFIFFFDFSVKALPEKKPSGKELSVEDMELANTPAEPYIPKVMPIPLPMNVQMEAHLKEFRKNAEALAVKYPDTFIISAPTEEKVCALTFDDGPDKATTDMIINILNHYNIKGTFFFIGNQISASRSIVSKAARKGNMVANHSWSHQRPTESNIMDLLHEISLTNSKLNQLGISTKHYRPPYGLVTDEQASRMSELGYKIVAWSVDSMDWYFDNPNDIYECVVNAVHPGAIILMHSAGGADNRDATVKALPGIIERLKSDGYRFVTVEEILEFKEIVEFKK